MESDYEYLEYVFNQCHPGTRVYRRMQEYIMSKGLSEMFSALCISNFYKRYCDTWMDAKKFDIKARLNREILRSPAHSLAEMLKKYHMSS